MIIDFTISNYGPFQNPATLTFEASKDKHLSSSYVREIELENGKSIKLLRMALLYGANSAGKTSILDALSLLDGFITSPVDDSETKLNINSFKFSENIQPTSIVIKFVRNGTVYRYQLDFIENSILNEILEYQNTPPNGKKFSRVYKRSRESVNSSFNIAYGPDLKLNKAETEKLNTELLPNITMLSVLNRKMAISNNKIKQAYSWFKNQLLGEVSPKINLTDWVTQRLQNDKVDQEHLIAIMNKADIPIQRLNLIQPKPTEMMSDIIKNISDDVRTIFLEQFNKRREPYTIYNVNGIEYELNLEKQESLGTQRYYGLAGLLSILCSDKERDEETHNPRNYIVPILPIDEIEHSLHPDLLEHFLTTFLKDSGDSQLIATTHYREFLLDRTRFRDDVIWFVDKDPETMSSDLYCLEDIKANIDNLRATSSVYNFYKSHQLGGIPRIGS